MCDLASVFSSEPNGLNRQGSIFQCIYSAGDNLHLHTNPAAAVTKID
jgi:hypothetical protein